MKHYLSILVILICIGIEATSQHRYSKLYNSESGAHDLSTRVEVLNDGYLFCSTTLGGTTPDTFNYAKQSLFIVKTNFAGDTIWTKKYYKRGIGMGARFSIAMSDSCYLLVGRIVDYVAYKDSNIQRDVLLVKINLTGDTLWTKTISLGKGDELPVQGIKTLDNSFVIIGQSCTQNVIDCDYFVLKVDSNGNEIFKKKYSFDTNFFEQGRAIVELEDSTLYLFGNTQDLIDEERAYLIKTDKNGNVIWDKRYPEDGFRKIGLTLNIIDSGLLLNITSATSDPNSGDANLVKVDTSGNIISQKQYGGDYSDELYRVLFLPDGSSIAVGTNQSVSPSNINVAWIVRMSSDGDTIFERTYSSMNILELKEMPCLLYDIKQMDDGFIILGFAFPKGDFPNSTQDVWLLRVDSMGCLYENCMASTGVTYASESTLQVYPNPATEKVNIVGLMAGTIQVFNVQGQLMYNDKTEEEEISISIEGWNSGVYIVRFQCINGTVMNTKLVVQH